MAEGARKLSEEELFQCLKSLNVPVRLNDLKVPTKEFMVRVCECFLKDLQIDITNSSLRPWEAMKHFEVPEIYDDAMLLMLLVSSMNLIFKQDDLQITIKDILEPKPKRTKKILNYVIVFWNYCFKMFSIYQDIDERFQQQKQNIEAVKQEKKAIEEQHKKCLELLENSQPNKDDLANILALKDKKVEEFTKQRDVVEAGYKAVKKIESDFKAQLSSAESKIISLKEKMNEIDQVLLTSPEKLTAELQKLKETIKNEDAKIKQKEAELLQKKNDLQVLKLFQENNEKGVDAIQEVHSGLTDLRNTINDLASVFLKVEEEDESMKKLKENLEMKEKSKQIYEQTSSNLQITTKKKKEMFIESHKKLQRDLAEEEKQLEIITAQQLKLEQGVELAVDSVLEVVRRLDTAEVETERKEAEYNAELDAMDKAFAADCDEIKSFAEKIYEV